MSSAASGAKRESSRTHVFELFDVWASKQRFKDFDEESRPLLIGEHASITCAEIKMRVLRLSDALRNHFAHDGLTRPAIGLCLDDNVSAVIAFFAVTHAGFVAMPFSRGTSRAFIEARLQRTQARACLTDREELLSSEDVDSSFESLCAWTLKSSEFVDEPRFAPGDTALWLFSSGTTGRSKVARIGHDALFGHTTNLAHHLGFSTEDRFLATLPLSHSFGLRMTVLMALASGAQILISERFDAAETLRFARDQGATFIAGVPTMFSRWAQVPGAPLPSLRWCLSAGAPLGHAIKNRAEERLGAEVRQGYGLTEASFSAIDAPHLPATLGSCGSASPGVEIRIEEADHSQRGEILIRGRNLFQGYLGDDDATSAAFTADGFLRTGDIGQWVLVDGVRKLRVVDRKKDIILRGGHNIVPSEVEHALIACGAEEAVVVGVFDEDLGQRAVAFVVGAFEVAELARHLKRAHFPDELVSLESTEELPLGPSGKVLRRVLRERLEKQEYKSQTFRR